MTKTSDELTGCFHVHSEESLSKIRELANEYSARYEYLGPDRTTHMALVSRNSFLAGAKSRDEEVAKLRAQNAVMIEALEDIRPNGWKHYVGEEACKVVLHMVQIGVDETLAKVKELEES